MIGGHADRDRLLMWLAENAGRKLRDLGSDQSARRRRRSAWRRPWPSFPDCSRSGITISAGLFRNLTRESAARFSFLLSTPAIGAAALKAIYDLHKEHQLARAAQHAVSWSASRSARSPAAW